MVDINSLVFKLQKLRAPREFVLIVLLVIWTEGLYNIDEAYDWLEFFAGHVMHHLPAKGSGPRLPILVWHQVFQLDPNECWDLLQGSLLQHRGSAHGLCWRGQ